MKILIVEDELNISQAIDDILKNAGYLTDTVYDGEEALDYALSEDYDGILLDVMLPKKDGFQVVTELRKKKSTPVLMLTARNTIADKVNGLNSGADDYLTKPFDNEELLARVNALTRRTGEVAMDELRLFDLTLNTNNGELSCNNESVQLSHKELEVARLFFLNPTMTLTKEVVINKVWGMDSDATDNNVEAYISFLRKKLKFIHSKVNIKNIQRLGYRMEEKND